jgi:hypothetical protein
MIAELENYINNIIKKCNMIIQYYYETVDIDQFVIMGCVIIWFGYILTIILSKLMLFSLLIIRCAIILFWNSLTPGIKLLELISIMSSISVVTITFIAGNTFIQTIDEQFCKLKNDLNEKNKEIEELKEKIVNLELEGQKE